MKKIFLISVLLAISITCFSQKGKWKKAQEINTIESYQKFLDKYPDSEFTEDAKINLIDLEYDKSIKTNTIEAYNDFLNKYPKNHHKYDVNERLSKLERKKKRVDKEQALSKQILSSGPEDRFIIPGIKANVYKSKNSLTIIQIKNDEVNEIRFLHVLPDDIETSIIFQVEKLSHGGTSTSLYQMNHSTGMSSANKSTESMTLPRLSLGVGSVHRYNTTVYLDDIGLSQSKVLKIDGSPDYPFAFLVTKDGYVHIYGSGRVTFKDGHSIYVKEKF